MRVLIAEDDPETAEFVRAGLAELGHTGEVATSGPDALHHATLDEWDMIILDRMLPVLDGVSVLKAVFDRRPYSPATILSAGKKMLDSRFISPLFP